MVIDISPTAFCELKIALTDAIVYAEECGSRHLANRYEEIYEQIAYCEKKRKRYYYRLNSKGMRKSHRVSSLHATTLKYTVRT